MISYFVSLIATILFLHYFLKISIRRNFLIDKNISKPQAFHANPTPMIGGTFLIISIFLNSYYLTDFDNLFLYFGLMSLMYLIGIIDDFEIVNNPYIRLALIVTTAFLIVTLLNLNIGFVDIVIIDFLLSNYIFSAAFTIACILFVVNGVNFLDGFNGLVSIHAIIIMIILLMINNMSPLNLSDTEISKLIFVSIICFFIFLMYNFPYGKIFLGDNGSYFTGIILSILVIGVYEINLNFVSPVFYAILLHLIFFEVFFSYFRKLLLGKSPFYPDKDHLHMIIYYILREKNLNFIKSNYVTSLIFNTYYLIILFPAFYYKGNTLFCLCYFFFLLIMYVSIYLFLLNYKNKKPF